MNQKLFSSVLAQEKDGAKAIEKAALKVNRDLGGKSCDLAILFVSEHYEDADMRTLAQKFKELVSPACLIGCNSSGVVGDKSEIEMEPAVSVLAMHLPGVTLHSFSLTPDEISGLKSGKDLVEALDLYPTDQPKFICLADPATCDVRELLRVFNEGYQGLPVIGGLASGGAVGLDNWLVLDGDIYLNGAVGVALVGDIKFDTIVSQGCRPIGEPLIITKAEQNILQELAGKPAIQVLSDLLGKLSTEDQNLAAHSLFVGVVMDERKESFERGDFLIRNIIGADQANGALAIGELLEVGQTLQFQLRDSETSREDLEALLEKSPPPAKSKKEGAILVSCCGRGRGLFGEPDHDIQMIQSLRGPVPVAGFFANGEFGPIDKKNYVHGYTSSLTIIS